MKTSLMIGILDQVRAHGCDCTPIIITPTTNGRMTQITVMHDLECGIQESSLNVETES